MKALPGQVPETNAIVAAQDRGSYRTGGGAANGAIVAATAAGQPNPMEVTFSPDDTKMRREAARKENLSECRSICGFLLFLIVFSAAVILDQNASSSRLADHVRGKLTGGKIPLDSVASVPELYDYLGEVVVPALYENSTDTNDALELSRFYHPVDVANRMIGGIRLRQARVEYTDGCQMGPMFSTYKVMCYPPFGPYTWTQKPFGPDDKFRWSRDNEGSPYQGYLGTYTANGFMEVLPTDREEAEAKLVQLEEDIFLGPWTRALFIDFVIWSSNVGTYAVTSVIVEFGASGGVASHISVLTMPQRMLSAGGLGAFSDQLALAFTIVVIIFVLFFLWEESLELKKSGFAYFLDGWNAMDWVNYIMLIAAFGIRAFCFAKSGTLEIGIKELDDPTSVPSLRGLAQLVEMVKLLNAVSAVLLWGKALKYLRHMPLLRDLVRTIWRALDSFVPFISMFAVAFIGFAFAYNIGFGDRIFELSTFGSAVTYLSRAFLRDVKLMPAYQTYPLFGAFLILVFYVTFLLVGVNVIFAIMADAMFWAKREEREKKDDYIHEEEPVEELVREVRRIIRTRCKRYFPKLYKKLYRKKRKAKKGDEIEVVEGPGSKGEVTVPDDDDESVDSFMSGESGPIMPTKEDLLRAIEHMAGRILSEVSILGIEIKSELHDVCERVAQMQMAVEELSMRADAVRLDQEEYIAANS